MTQNLTTLDSSGCAVSVWKHLYVTLVKFHNTHAKSNAVLKKNIIQLQYANEILCNHVSKTYNTVDKIREGFFLIILK